MPNRLPTIRIFISSPADVRPERLKAEQIVARLDREFAYHFHVEAVLWEREPLVAAHHFQDAENIPQPRGMNIVVVILWSWLGVLLPQDKFSGALSERPVTGTEWEFEDALAGARATGGTPDLLLYRKTAEPVSSLGDRKALDERLAQLDLVEDFIGRWFRAEGGGEGFTAASHSFATATEFEEKLYEHLRALLERRAGAAAEGVAIHWHEAPYRGLLSFDFEHAPVFFGRTRARNELRELLARREAAGSAFVLVLGASGSGKSSLVKAGLLPDLMLPGMIGWVGLVRWGVLRPSDTSGDPLDGLAAAILSATALPELAGLQYTPEQLGTLLRSAPAQAVLPIRQGLAAAAKPARRASRWSSTSLKSCSRSKASTSRSAKRSSRRWRHWQTAGLSGSSRRCAVTSSIGLRRYRPSLRSPARRGFSYCRPMMPRSGRSSASRRWRRGCVSRSILSAG